MLLDDVMSELDAERRELLAELLRAGGQAVITTTEPEHVPGTALAGGGLIRVRGRRRERRRAGGGRVRRAWRDAAEAARERLAARLSVALEGVVRGAEPDHPARARAGRLAGGGGPRSAASAAPVSERDGVVTVACESAVWAQELELLGPDLLTRFGDALAAEPGRPAAGSVKKLRFVVGSAPNQ